MELINVLSFLCGIAVGWFLIGIFPFKRNGQVFVNGQGT
jgi:hypothetical protein